MTFPVTLGAALAFAAVAVFSGWRVARPPDLQRGPRLVPWRMIMLLSTAGVMFMLVHLVNLLGFTTGRP